MRAVKEYRKALIAVAVAAALMTGVCCKGRGAGSASEKNPDGAAAKDVFACTSAGRWYPAEPGKLRKMVDGYLGKAEKKKLPGRVVALMSPHAGFVYSGPVAATAYRQVEGVKYDTVVVIGFNHRVRPGEGIAIYDRGAFSTPLGVMDIDVKIAADLEKASPLIKHNPGAFSGEHSLDDQLPFVQRAMSGFKLVPMLMTEQTPANVDALSSALVKALKGKNALIVASSDMSHFWSHEEAAKLDAAVLEKVLARDDKGLAELLSGDADGRRLCGRDVVEAVIRAAVALGADGSSLIKYADSFDTYGETGSGVVGYGSVVFTNSKLKQGKAESSPREVDKAKPAAFGGELDREDQAQLLKIARQALMTGIGGEKSDAYRNERSRLELKRGVFVTINKNNELRGCMGHFEADTPLYKIVARQALIAATQDPRFLPLDRSELGKITIEISVLSEPKAVASYKDIVVGTHGVILRNGMNGATFLPQVAPEQGWTLDEMLTQLSRKAGLAADAWKDPATTFQVYTAQVFGEDE